MLRLFKAHLYPSDEEIYDERDENCTSNSEEDESFYCELCDRDFSTENALLEHKKEHKVCGIDGCTFSAHPLLIQKHISMQHSNGLYHKIKNVSTPEDIEKWILERKRKYPSKANIEQKKAEESEKTQRGEIIKERTGVPRKRRKKLTRFGNRKRTIPEQVNKAFSNVVQQREVYRGISAFSGTLSFINEDLEEKDEVMVVDDLKENVDCISDEEETVAVLPKFTLNSSTVSSLVANYGSTTDDSETPDEVPIKKVEWSDKAACEKLPAMKTEVMDKKHVIEKTRVTTKTEKKVVKIPSIDQTYSISEIPKRKENILSNENFKKKTIKSTKKSKQPYTSQLLQRLLSQSIQHERNVISQCIKYIVDNHFFE